MAKKLVRMYLSTFVDVELDENDFKDKDEMIDYVKHNASDYITPQDVYDNICDDPQDFDVYDEDEL